MALHPEILSEAQRNIVPAIVRFADEFVLVGGTAIALQIGHRASIDFDMFTHEPVQPFSAGKIRRRFESEALIGKVLVDEEDEYTFFTKTDVKCTFARPPFVVPREVEFVKGVMMPSLISLAAMKAYTLGRRNKWKDYVDLYFLLRDHVGMSEVVGRGVELFPTEFSEKLFRVQLAAHEDINYSERVQYMDGHEVDDAVVRNFLTRCAVGE